LDDNDLPELHAFRRAGNPRTLIPQVHCLPQFNLLCFRRQ
jgi:hypothetical protein